MAADIAQRRRAEQRIGNRVQQCVGIRMTEQTAAVRDRDAAEDQFTSRYQGVAVITLADAKWKWIHARWNISVWLMTIRSGLSGSGNG